MEICRIRHSSNHFQKQPGNKLIAEASDLQQGSRRELFGAVYDDSCDEGFVIVSERTGREATFAVDSRDEAEGEVRAWELVPTKKTLRQHPHLAGLRVVVLND